MSKYHRGRTVIVEDDNVDKAIKKLRRRVIQQEILKDYMFHTHYTKQSYLNKKKKNRKLFLSRLQAKLEKQKNKILGENK